MLLYHSLHVPVEVVAIQKVHFFVFEFLTFITNQS